MKKINAIYYPNTEPINSLLTFGYYINDKSAPSVSLSNCLPVDEINIILKNGEMSLINWIEIKSQGKTIAEIKESVCNIFY